MKWWKTYRALLQMRGRLRWSPDRLRAFRDQRLRELVRFAYDRSLFYRRFYDEAGVRPEEIQSQADLHRLPLLKKTHLQQNDPLDIVTVQTASGDSASIPWVTESTSGSTGLPLKIMRTWNDLYLYKAKEIRAFEQTGFRFYHRQVILKSSSDSVTGRHWFENFGILSKFWLSIRDPEERNVELFRKIRPHHVHAYPSGLKALADYLDAHGEKLRVPLICTGAEVLDDVTRQQIERAFQAEVFDLYGSREVGNIAWECPAHDGMHVNDDAIILELLDDQNQPVPEGKEGRVVVTWLEGRDWPFIRYDLGDRATLLPGQCSCGVTFSRLARLEGRNDGRILLPSGVWISGMFFQELRATSWAAAFRIVQDDLSAIRLQLVLRRQPTPEEMDGIIAKTRALVHGELRIIPEILPQLERDASGKMRCVICRLPEAAGTPVESL
jgi:phenylacetate-CoA ligase